MFFIEVVPKRCLPQGVRSYKSANRSCDRHDYVRSISEVDNSSSSSIRYICSNKSCYLMLQAQYHSDIDTFLLSPGACLGLHKFRYRITARPLRKGLGGYCAQIQPNSVYGAAPYILVSRLTAESTPRPRLTNTEAQLLYQPNVMSWLTHESLRNTNQWSWKGLRRSRWLANSAGPA